jgi:hypothetical protein
MGLKITDISLNLPFGIGGVTVARTEAQREAAWALYVEYATRVTTQALGPGQGSLREALSSMYRLFEVTREVLKAAGPGVADGPNSLGPLAIRVLNEGLRPFLAEWHTRLGEFEDSQRLAQREKLGPGVEAVIDEGAWHQADEFRQALEDRRQGLAQYVEELAKLAGIKDKQQQKR